MLYGSSREICIYICVIHLDKNSNNTFTILIGKRVTINMLDFQDKKMYGSQIYSILSIKIVQLGYTILVRNSLSTTFKSFFFLLIF